MVSGVVSTAGPGSAQPGSDDLVYMDNPTPSSLLVFKSFSPIQEVLKGSLKLNRGRSQKLCSLHMHVKVTHQKTHGMQKVNLR